MSKTVLLFEQYSAALQRLKEVLQEKDQNNRIL